MSLAVFICIYQRQYATV